MNVSEYKGMVFSCPFIETVICRKKNQRKQEIIPIIKIEWIVIVYEIIFGQANFMIKNIKGPICATCISNVKMEGSLHLSGRSCTMSGNSTNILFFSILDSCLKYWSKFLQYKINKLIILNSNKTKFKIRNYNCAEKYIMYLISKYIW